ncbi:MAG: hypothetical protein KH330_01605 [Clostridiales bacterium]|nr:hypothetical protein [Clostridiales bacterium]
MTNDERYYLSIDKTKTDREKIDILEKDDPEYLADAIGSVFVLLDRNMDGETALAKGRKIIEEKDYDSIDLSDVLENIEKFTTPFGVEVDRLREKFVKILDAMGLSHKIYLKFVEDEPYLGRRYAHIDFIATVQGKNGESRKIDRRYGVEPFKYYPDLRYLELLKMELFETLYYFSN